jgi:hypothetical protein
MLILYFFVIFSCISKKIITPSTTAVTDDKVFDLVKTHNIDFKKLSIRGNIDFQSGDTDNSGSFFLQMVKDSIVVTSIRKFGLEIAKLKVDPQDYTLLYKLESSYEQKPISSLRELVKINLNFSELQKILVGNVILGTDSLTVIQNLEDQYILKTKNSDLKIAYTINKKTKELTDVQYITKENQRVHIQFHEYREVLGLLPKIAHLKMIDVYEGPNSIAKITIETDEIILNDTRSIKFEIPEKYERI